VRDQLIEKLDHLLVGRLDFSEAEAVYFLVESRKLLDRSRAEGENLYPLVRFYADWSVHTAKERQLDSIRPIAAKLAAASTSQTTGDAYNPDRLRPHADFIYMKALREEVHVYLEKFGITDPFRDDAVWNAFASSLTAVLHDQPIVAPHEEIKEIRYELSTPGSAVLVVEFHDRDPIKVGNVF